MQTLLAPCFQGFPTFVTSHSLLSQINPVHPNIPFKIHFDISSNLCLRLPTDFFPSNFFRPKVCMFPTHPRMLQTPPIWSSFLWSPNCANYGTSHYEVSYDDRSVGEISNFYCFADGKLPDMPIVRTICENELYWSNQFISCITHLFRSCNCIYTRVFFYLRFQCTS